MEVLDFDVTTLFAKCSGREFCKSAGPFSDQQLHGGGRRSRGDGVGGLALVTVGVDRELDELLPSSARSDPGQPRVLVNGPQQPSSRIGDLGLHRAGQALDHPPPGENRRPRGDFPSRLLLEVLSLRPVGRDC